MSLKSKLQTVADVFQHYPYKVKRISNEPSMVKKGVWLVDTNAGKKVLKRVTVDESRMNFLLEAVGYLREHDVAVLEPQPTVSGNFYVGEDGAFFTVTNAVKGATFDYYKQMDLKALMESLAKFHRAAQGFQPQASSTTVNKLGSWPKTWSRHRELVKEMASSLKRGRSLADRLLARELEYFWERSANLSETLESSQYGVWVEQVQVMGGLTHQEFHGGHVMFQSDLAPRVLDWSKMCIELPARDLRKTCLKILQHRGEWNSGLLIWLFQRYQAVLPLTNEQWNVVLLDMKYPHQFFYLLERYYQKRQRGWIDSRYGQKFKEVIKAEIEKQRFFDEFRMIT